MQYKVEKKIRSFSEHPSKNHAVFKHSEHLLQFTTEFSKN